MRKEGLGVVVGIVLCLIPLLVLVMSAPVGITIDKPLNQSYNYLNHTINVTTDPAASSCRYIVNASSQGVVWQQILPNPGWIPVTWPYKRYGMGVAVSPNGTIWVVGGYDGYANYFNDVWYSPDGNTWTQATAAASFAGRYNFGFAIKSDGSLWLMGGLGSESARYNDVWNSTNGVDWTLVNISVAWENRSDFQTLITTDDVMWVIGGDNTSISSNHKGDVWNSSNGINWNLVNGTAFAGRREYGAVVGDNNRIWVFGGWDGNYYYPDVWYSDDKINWFSANTSVLPWGSRYGFSTAYTPSDKRIWLFGGYDKDASSAKSDAWYTQNGADWTQAASSNSWGERQSHSTVVTPNGTIFLIGGDTTSTLWKSSPPVTMEGSGTSWGKAINASEGGNFIGIECNDSGNLWNATNISFYTDTQVPLITIFNPVNMTYNGTTTPVAANVTVSETASTCVASLNGAANLTMNGSGTEWGITLAFAEGSNTIVISCNDTIDWWNSSSITFFYDSILPIINITKPFNITYSTAAMTVNATTNEASSVCSYAHNVTSEQNWTLLNLSAFSSRQGHTIVNLNGTLWLIGGVTLVGGEIPSFLYLNDTWYSTDGITWTLGNASTAFTQRAYHTSVVKNNTIWVIAGYDGENYLNDTWFSTDGINWEQANASAFPGRYSHTSLVDNDGKIWVIAGRLSSATGDPPIVRSGDFSIYKGGGGEAAPTNTTWCSPDGYSWMQVNASAFPARYAHSSAIDNNGRMWVMGGINSEGAAINDVWYSDDGGNWTEAASSAAWNARKGQVSFATSDNRIWVIGGTDEINYYNDVWYTANGIDWKNVNSTTNSSFWTARKYFAGAVKGDYIYIVGGEDASGNLLNDSWSSPIPPWYKDMDGSGTTWGKDFIAAHGYNNVKVRCRDLAGNLNSTMQWFSVDIQGPEINISSPTNTSYAISSITLTISLDEPASECVYSLNGAANVTMSGSSTSWNAAATASNGGNTITVSCQDTLGNWNSESVAFTASFSTIVCGNNVCESGETCSSCPTDCGACAGGTSGSLSGGVSSQKAEKDISFSLIANLPVEKAIEKEGIAVEKVTISANENAEKVNLEISRYDALPTTIKPPEGNVYQALEIELDKEVDVKEAEICFNVEKQWMEANDVLKEEVTLVRYNPRRVLKIEKVTKQDGRIRAEVKADIEYWQELETVWVEKPAQTSSESFCAKTPGFSTYAIVSKKKQAMEIIEEAAPIVEAMHEEIPARNEYKIPFSPQYKKIYIIILIDIIAIFLLIAAFSTGSQLFEEKKELWYQCNAMVRKSPDSRKVKEFIKSALERGYSENDVKQAVAGHGIDETCVEMLIESIKAELKAEQLKESNLKR